MITHYYVGFDYVLGMNVLVRAVPGSLVRVDYDHYKGGAPTLHICFKLPENLILGRYIEAPAWNRHC